MSLRERINAANDLNREPIELWGESLYVRELTLGELSQLSDEETSSTDLGTKSAMLIGMSLCDENGERIWPELDEAALTEIKSKSFSILRRATEAANRINGLEDDEDIPGNSGSAPS